MPKRSTLRRARVRAPGPPPTSTTVAPRRSPAALANLSVEHNQNVSSVETGTKSRLAFLLPLCNCATCPSLFFGLRRIQIPARFPSRRKFWLSCFSARTRKACSNSATVGTRGSALIAFSSRLSLFLSCSACSISLTVITLCSAADCTCAHRVSNRLNGQSNYLSISAL